MLTRKSLYLFLLIFAGYLLVYIIPLGSRPLVMPDETRYAEISREMLASHDFTVPRLAGLRYFEKPVMGYWINSLFLHVFGQNAFGIRIASAASAALSALLVTLLLWKFGDKNKFLPIVPAIFLTGFGVFMLGVHSCLDSMFALFVTGMLISFFFAYMAQGRRRTHLLLFAGLFCGVAFMTKGFVAFMFAGIVIVPFLMWERQWKAMLTMAWWPLAATLAVAVPWGIAVHLREPDFWHYFFVVENLHRFASSDAQHAEPVWYYVPMLLEGLFPWIFIVPAAVIGLAGRRKADPVVRFAVCWAVLPFIFFTISDGKLGTYLLPLFPAYIILIALGLQKYFENGGNRVFAIGSSLLSIAIAITIFVLIRIPFSRWNDSCSFSCDLSVLKAAVLSATGIWCVLSGIAGLRSGLKPETRIMLIAAGTAVFLSTIHFSSSAMINSKNPIRFLEVRRGEISEKSLIVADSCTGPSACWVYKRDDIYIINRGEELEYGLSAEDSRSRFLDFAAFNAMAEELAGRNMLFLILKERTYKKYRQYLVEPASVDAVNGFVFARY